MKLITYPKATDSYLPLYCKPLAKGTSRGDQEELSLMPSYETDVLAQLCTN